MTAPRTLADLTFEELQAALASAESDAELAQYADSNTPLRKARERVDAIKAEITRRQRRAST